MVGVWIAYSDSSSFSFETRSNSLNVFSYTDQKKFAISEINDSWLETIHNSKKIKLLVFKPIYFFIWFKKFWVQNFKRLIDNLTFTNRRRRRKSNLFYVFKSHVYALWWTFQVQAYFIWATYACIIHLTSAGANYCTVI